MKVDGVDRCKHGHVNPRRYRNGTCSECMRESRPADYARQRSRGAERKLDPAIVAINSEPHQCSKCRVIKQGDLFPFNRHGRRDSWCHACRALDRKERYAADPKRISRATYASRRKKSLLLVVKLAPFKAVPCADCGGRFPSVVMDFDHRDPTIKVDPVSRMVNRALSWERIAAEMAKCDVVCSNCHRIRTWIGGRRLRVSHAH